LYPNTQSPSFFWNGTAPAPDRSVQDTESINPSSEKFALLRPPAVFSLSFSLRPSPDQLLFPAPSFTFDLHLSFRRFQAFFFFFGTPLLAFWFLFGGRQFFPFLRPNNLALWVTVRNFGVIHPYVFLLTRFFFFFLHLVFFSFSSPTPSFCKVPTRIGSFFHPLSSTLTGVPSLPFFETPAPCLPFVFL